MVLLASCYKSDYQESIREEFPGCKIFQLDEQGSSDDYLIVTQDSSVYSIECHRLFSTRPSNKRFLFNFKTVLK